MSSFSDEPVTAVTTRAAVAERLTEAGYAFLAPAQLDPLLQIDVRQLDPLREWWDCLPRDQYLRDGGRYRSTATH